MTKRKIEYWVIPPDQDAEFVADMETCSRPMQKRMIGSTRCCAWTNNPCNC